MLEGQSSTELGLLPAVNVNLSLNTIWKINGKIESRFGTKEDIRSNGFQHLLSDASVIASRNVSQRTLAALGFLLRLREGGITQRSIQQVTFLREYHAFRLSHRLSADQTWSSTSDLKVRLRYRAVALLPLDGTKVNSAELYIKIGSELLHSYQSKDHGIEFRVTPALGYQFTDMSKLEVGIDHRIDGLLDSKSLEHFTWGSIGWYVSF